MKEFDRCPSCEIEDGKLHTRDCNISRCRLHGEQFLFCSGLVGCSPTKFTGYYPGSEEAIERGWYVYRDANRKWIPCNEQQVGAMPDINRVIEELSWSSIFGRYL